MAKRRGTQIAVAIDLAWPYRHHVDVFAGIQQYAKEHTDWTTVVDPFCNDLAEQRYDGIVGRISGELAAAARTAGVPVVNTWSASPDKTIPGVVPHLQSIGRVAAEYLLNRGYRRFGFLGRSQPGTTTAIYAGFCLPIRMAKCNCTAIKVASDADQSAQAWRRFQTRLDTWVASFKPPLAILAASDFFCRHLAQACLRAGLSIPEDVALIGQGNNSILCLHPDPSLSSIEVDFERIGFEAAHLLHRLLQGDHPPPGPTYCEPVGIVPRNSTDIYVVEDPLVCQALQFINGSLCDPISSSDVARHLATTPQTLERHVRPALGRSVTEEISRQRIERAKRLLLESNDPIKAVASKCGFSHVTYFHEVFARLERVTPGEFRSQKGKRSSRGKKS